MFNGWNFSDGFESRLGLEKRLGLESTKAGLESTKAGLYPFQDFAFNMDNLDFSTHTLILMPQFHLS